MVIEEGGVVRWGGEIWGGGLRSVWSGGGGMVNWSGYGVGNLYE